MDKRRITFTDILVAGLVLVMVINIFWFFNKKPLTKNLNLEDSTGNIRFAFSESVKEDRGDEGTYYNYITYYIDEDFNDEKIKPILDVLDGIQSRKRLSGRGSILVHTAGMSDLSVTFMVDNHYYDYILTDRDNIMRCLSPNSNEIISITLNDGDFEKIASAIKQHGTEFKP